MHREIMDEKGYRTCDMLVRSRGLVLEREDQIAREGQLTSSVTFSTESAVPITSIRVM